MSFYIERKSFYIFLFEKYVFPFIFGKICISFYLGFILSKTYNSFYLGFIFGIPTFPPCGIHQTNQKSLSRVDVTVGAVSVIAPTIFKGNLNYA